MPQKNAFILAAAISAFTLVVLGGLVTGVMMFAGPTQVNPQPSVVQPPAGDAATTLSPDLAATIALNLAPGSRLLQTPELVNADGTVAYEVLLDTGKVYVNATTGTVLGTQFNTSTSVSASNHEANEEHEEHEHEDD